MLVVVKYVVKEILPHFRGTFKSGDWGGIGGKRGSAQHFGKSNRFDVPAPKSNALTPEPHKKTTTLF